MRDYGNGKRGTVWKVGDCSFDFGRGIMDVIDSQGQRFTCEDWNENTANLIRQRRLGVADPVGEGNVARQLDLSSDGDGREGAARSYRVMILAGLWDAFLCASGPGPGGHAPKASRSSCLRSPSGMSSLPRCFTVHPARGHLPFVNFVSKSIPCKQAAPVSSLILFITLIIRLGKGR